jgi:hypothetical protein
MNNSIQFELAEFSKIFPFYILFDENLIIQSHGPSIEKVAPNCKEKQFSDFFMIERPLLSEYNFLEITNIANQLVFLKSKNVLEFLLKGQFNYLAETNQIIFVGAAWFDSTETLTHSGLNLLDFAPHNPLIDLLHLLKTQEIVNDELKQLVHKLNEQKKKLVDSQNQLEKTRILLEENNIRHFHWWSLDVEGFELSALQGLDFSRWSPDYINIELWNNDSAVWDFLGDRGYKAVADISPWKHFTPHRDIVFRSTTATQRMAEEISFDY